VANQHWVWDHQWDNVSIWVPGGDEAVHGTSPRGVPAQLFQVAGGRGLKEEVKNGVELFLVDSPAGIDFCGGFIG